SVRGLENCGVIGIWSRPFRNRQRRQAPVDLADLERLIAERKVYTADQVDQPAVLAPGSASSPPYPDSLWNAGASGGAVAEFIVDAGGYIESGTVRIVSSTHPYFGSSVRSSLEGAAFEPARLGGQPVRQLVQLPFRFERKDDSGGREAPGTR
ncbi:MAG: TonB family protein, partial [Gemmatimonadota bacterium]|nr:TonB family protein [Gemmatimonadota bacterium]